MSEVFETITVEVAVENLNKALDDLKETDDYITYATLLDEYMSPKDLFDYNDKVILLTAVLKILENNPDLVYEIGWDIPELLLKFIDTEWEAEHEAGTPLQLVRLSLKCFDVLARAGNPKELFIKVIEIFEGLKLPDGSADGSNEKELRKWNCLDTKIHALFELIKASLKRINTLYPSKFLGMAIASILRFLSSYQFYSYQQRFLLRRIYVFIRDYIPPMKPLNYLEKEGITEEEARKIEDDENYLQSKLMQSFITNLYTLAFSKVSLCLSFKNYHNLQLSKKGQPPFNYDDDSINSVNSTCAIFERILNLSMSLDIDFLKEFQKLQDDSLELFSKIDDKKTDDEKIQDLIKLSVNDLIENLYHPESEKIPLNASGLFVACAQFDFSIQELSISTHELILMSIRFLSPGLLSEKFKSFGYLDAVLYFNWKNIVKDSKSQDYAEIPRYQMILFLQIIIFYAAVTNDPSVGLVSYTLLTRILTLVSEDLAYDFLIDTLTTAPYENAKMAIISILKDLILRTRPDGFSVDEINEKLEATKLEESGDSKTVTPPSLPKRSFVTLNQSRVDDIYALIRESIDETFPESGEFNEETAKLTLGYLNFLIGIRTKYPVDKQKEIKASLDEKLVVDLDENNNNLQLIRLSQTSLGNFLK